MTTLDTSNPPPEVTAGAQQTLTPVIVEKLHDLRAALWRWLIVAGLGRFMLWLVALLAIDFVLDYMFRFDNAERLILAIAMVVVLLVVFMRRVVRPLAVLPDDDALCAHVEARHHEAGQRVITALQFSRSHDAEAQGVSSQLVANTIESGDLAAQGLDFSDVLNRRSFNRHAMTVAICLGVLGLAGIAVAATDTGAIWFNRNILLGDRQWPQDTRLLVKGVKDGRVVIPRGDDWMAVVEAEGEVPAIVTIEYGPAEASLFGSTSEQQMKQIGDRSFETPFKNVIERFRFRVSGGDDRGQWIEAKLVDRPKVAQLDLTLTPPTYTGDQDKPLPPGKSPYDALVGSALSITGWSDQPLSGASLRIADSDPLPIQIDAQPTPGPTPGRTPGPPDTLDQRPAWRFTTTVPADALEGGLYTIQLTNDTGLTSRPPTRFALRLRADAEPTVKASLVGIGTLVVPKARIPIDINLTDDFAITDARLVHHAQVDQAGLQPPAPDGGAPQESAQHEERTLRLDGLKDAFAAGESRIAHEYAFEILPYSLPVGATLGFRIEATDNDAVTGPKVGKSRMFYLTVVTEQMLRDDLLRREQEQRQEFTRLLKDQDNLWVQTRSIRASLGDTVPTPDEPYQALSRIQKRQRLVADRCRVIARQFEQIKAEVLNNRIEESGGPAESRLQRRIIDPLNAIADDLSPPAADLLDDARRLSSEAGPRGQALAAAADQQQRVLQTMRDILTNMVKWEGYQEALNLAYEVAGAQEQVNDATLKELQRRIRQIFGDDE